MKVALFALALVAVVAPILASRELKQLDIDFGVCPALVRRNCCQDFDFGNITKLHAGKEWPENTECEFTVSDAELVGIRPLNKPLKKKDDIHEYVKIDIVERPVNLVTTITWILVKYQPPNNLWSNGAGDFCVCPSPGAAAASTATTVSAVEPEEKTTPKVATRAAAIATAQSTAAGNVGPGVGVGGRR